MRWFRRLSQWWRLRANAEELAEEMSFHRALIEQDLIAQGHSAEEARVQARRAMGNETFMREESRGVWLWPRLEGILQDAKTTLRGLRKSPAFTLGVALTFALGIGANAAMFSLVDRLMFRPPTFMRDPSSANLVYLYKMRDGTERRTGGQYVRAVDIAKFTHSFSEVSSFTIRNLAVGVGQNAIERDIGAVNANFFTFFDAPPAAGRYFTAAEDVPPVGTPVVVLSYALWSTQFGSRRDAIGSALQIGPVVYTIIGVAPEGFVGLWPRRPPAAFVPVSTVGSADGVANWWTDYGHGMGLETMVRRKPGVSIDAASADLANAFTRSLVAQIDIEPAGGPITKLRPRAVAASILEARGPQQSNSTRITVWLGGVALIVLLIACANVANLLLARALSRRREIAMRIALGVTRTRLLAQLLTESLLLAALGSAIGIVAAVWMSAMLNATFFPGTAESAIVTDTRTLVFVAIVTLVVGVCTGILPLVQARRLTLTADLASGSRGGTQHRSRARVALLVLQSALSLVLLVGAGLFVRSVQHVRDVRIGFDADSVLVVELKIRGAAADSARAVELRQRLLAAATTVPGIRHATFQLSTPFNGMWGLPLFVPGVDSLEKFGDFELNGVSPEYFSTMGTRILRGRAIDRTDVAGASRAMVVGASMAATLWPGDNAIGKCVHVEAETAPCTYVVGIAEDIHTHGVGPEERYFYYYLPITQMHPEQAGLFVRTPGDPRDFVEPLRKRLQQEMPGTSYVTVTRLGERLEEVTLSWVMGAKLFTAMGVLALALAAVGLYSVIAYAVAQRRQELAVRVALGAGSMDMLRLVVVDGIRYAVTGIALGGAIAFALSNRIAPLLFSESARDLAVFGVVVGIMLVVAVVASFVPALRASRVEPRAVLQAD